MPAPQVKPCPFCGGASVSIYRTTPKEFVVYCMECAAQTRDRQSAQIAVDKWNVRTTAGIGRRAALDAKDFVRFHAKDVPLPWKETEGEEK